MKRFVAIFFIVLSIVCAKDFATASDYGKITGNSKIADSLRCLENINSTDVIAILNGRNNTGKPIRVLFRDFAMFGMSNCEAATLKTQSGGLIIYINKKHENAPSEAIACLIAHESQHHTQTNTHQEELRAWLKEVSTWNAFVRKDPTVAYSNTPLVKRENYINKLYVRDNNGSEGIRKLIVGNSAYKNLN